MKIKFVPILTVFFLSTLSSYAQDDESMFDYFFKPRPIQKGIVESNPIWEFKPSVQIPALKLTESNRENAQIDASFLASAGGGITLQRSIQKDGKNYSTISWSPAIFLLTGDTTEDNPLDLSYCTTIGFLNNIIQIGAGYDLGVVENRSRFFGVLSFGINLTNN